MWTRDPRPRRALAIALVLLLTAACGSRLDHDEHVAANSRGGGSDSGDDSSDDADADDEADLGGGITIGGDGGPSGTDGAVGTTGTDGGTTGAVPSGPGPEGEITPGTPLRIGMIGNFGGVAGASFVSARESLKAWVGMINAKGGIKGHPVELLVADDGNEGARDLAIAKDYIENRGVIALVNYFGGAGGPDAVAKYATQKGVPVIGGAAFDATFFRHPIMFPQITGHENYYYSSAKVMKDAGMDKVAIVYCSEGAVCKENADVFKKYALQLGLEVVYEAGVSLAQPDFTAECLNARAAGANAFYPQADGSTVNRLARSCSRQGFNARYYLPAPVDPPDALIEGAIATIRTFPWFIESGSPALEEYGQAMRRYAPNTVRNSFTTSGWMSGKVFELAAQNVSAKPTSQEILEGLWKIQDETFGGISPAITYRKGQVAPRANCAFYLEVKGGKWIAPKGMELVACL